MSEEKSKIVDIYDGEYIYMWQDGEDAFISVIPNGLTFRVPLEYLTDLFTEFAKAQTCYQVMSKEKEEKNEN